MLTAEMIWNSVQSDDDRDDFFWKDGELCHYLDQMPFDIFEDGRGFIHALGYEVWSEECQRWRPAYEK